MSKRLTTEEFVNRCKNIHGDKYDYSYVNYINNRTKIKIFCKQPGHGIFHQIPYDHQKGCGCKKCMISAGKLRDTLTTDAFIKKAKYIHSNKYDYSKSAYINSHNFIIIVCPKHGEFKQKAYSHLQGIGCAKCTHIVSQPETKFLDYYNIPMKNRQYKILHYKVDGIDLKTKTIYEFLGNYWHGNPNMYDDNFIHPVIKKTMKELRDKTFKKFDILKCNGYSIKFIWEADWKMFFDKNINKPDIKIYSKNF